MACSLCRSIPTSVLDTLDSDIRTGGQSLDTLATSYDTTAELVEEHKRKCLDGGIVSAYDNLANSLVDTQNLARRQMKRLDEQKLDQDAMDNLIALHREIRSTILAMEKIKPSETLVLEISANVLSPYIRSILEIIVQECGDSLRSKLLVLGGEALYPKVDREIKSSLQRTSIRLSNLTKNLVPILRSIMKVDMEIEELTNPIELPEVEPSTN